MYLAYYLKLSRGELLPELCSSISIRRLHSYYKFFTLHRRSAQYTPGLPGTLGTPLLPLFVQKSSSAFRSQSNKTGKRRIQSKDAPLVTVTL